MKTMIGAGGLRHHIEIGRYVSGKDEHGDPTTLKWERVACLWASVEGLRGSHYFQAQQTLNQADHKIIIRYNHRIRPGMIARHDGRELTIQSALDEGGRRRYLTLICREVGVAET